ncbi:MAG: HD-GYP domain-containing protein [Halanaerobiales bacterium]
MKIKKVAIEELKPGMRTAKMIENQFGAILVTSGMILDNNLIDKLKRTGLFQVEIIDEAEEELERNQNKFTEQYTDSVENIKTMFSEVQDKDKLNFSNIKNIAENSLEMDTNRDIVTMLSLIRDVDEYTYTHSVNVGLLAMLFGRWAGLSDQKIKELLYAGMLHDIGKAKISDEILNKKGKLTDEEFDIIRRHTVYGYDLARKCKLVSDSVSRGILMHHERNNSSGYPFGFSKKKIPFIARVLAIVDTYDAMTSDRVYKGHRPPFEVFKVFEEDLHSYDLMLSKIFMTNMAQFYLGEMVELSNDWMGEIVYINPNQISKPIVKVGEQFIDLSENGLEIKELYVQTDIQDADILGDL